MPSYYQNINGRLIGGKPEIIRLDDGCEPLISNYNKKEMFSKKKNTSLEKKEKFTLDLNDKSDYVQNMIINDANYIEDNANCNNTYVFQRKYYKPLEFINNRIDDFNHPNVNTPGFRFALDKPMIGLRPSYSSYVYKCPQVEYNSTDFYPFLLNDNLLFPPTYQSTNRPNLNNSCERII